MVQFDSRLPYSHPASICAFPGLYRSLHPTRKVHSDAVKWTDTGKTRQLSFASFALPLFLPLCHCHFLIIAPYFCLPRSLLVSPIFFDPAFFLSRFSFSTFPSSSASAVRLFCSKSVFFLLSIRVRHSCDPGAFQPITARAHTSKPLIRFPRSAKRHTPVLLPSLSSLRGPSATVSSNSSGQRTATCTTPVYTYTGTELVTAYSDFGDTPVRKRQKKKKSSAVTDTIAYPVPSA